MKGLYVSLKLNPLSSAPLNATFGVATVLASSRRLSWAKLQCSARGAKEGAINVPEPLAAAREGVYVGSLRRNEDRNALG